MHTEAEALADFTENVARRHPHVVEGQLRRTALAHRLDEVRRPAHVPIHQERRGPAAAGALLPVGDRYHDGEVRLVAVGDEGLLSIEDPVVAVLARAHLDVRGVRPGSRLGDCEAGDALTLDGGDQVLLLLVLIAQIEDVVCLAAEPERHKRVADLGPDQRLHNGGQVHPAVLLRSGQSPEAESPRLVLELAQLVAGEAWLVSALATQHLVLERDDLFADERPRGFADRFLFVIQ